MVTVYIRRITCQLLVSLSSAMAVIAVAAMALAFQEEMPADTVTVQGKCKLSTACDTATPCYQEDYPACAKGGDECGKDYQGKNVKTCHDEATSQNCLQYNTMVICEIYKVCTCRSKSDGTFACELLSTAPEVLFSEIDFYCQN